MSWFISCLALLVWSLPAAAATTVVIKGSTTVLPIAQSALEAYMKTHPGVNISLSGGGSGEGIKALRIGQRKLHIITGIKDKEAASARAKGIQPLEHVVALDAIVPIVHPANRITGLTLDQLSQIYQGKIRNWKEGGGNDQPIVVVSRDSSSGTYESWGHLVLNGAKVTPRAQIQFIQWGSRADDFQTVMPSATSDWDTERSVRIGRQRHSGYSRCPGKTYPIANALHVYQWRAKVTLAGSSI
jgi:phosphate transport system substrate-binding protein